MTWVVDTVYMMLSEQWLDRLPVTELAASSVPLSPSPLTSFKSPTAVDPASESRYKSLLLLTSITALLQDLIIFAS